MPIYKSFGTCFTRRCAAAAGPRRGVTLVELLIAVAILSIGILGLVKTFSSIQRAVQGSKNKTLASNLAQEKMQILKQKTYYQVLVTTDPAHNNTDFAPEVLDYDTGYFPPEEITEGGVTYTRYTYVQSLREDSGVVAALAPGTADVGMKRITITVAWGAGDGRRKVVLRSILSNPDTVMANVTFTGTVTSTAGVPIQGALVNLVEGTGWADTTDNMGRYNITATPGTFSLLATATGYFSGLKSVVIAAAETQTNNFMLGKMGVGTITGFPWIVDHLVISQVVGSTKTSVTGEDYDQEYVEVFNPTTFTWTMDGNVGLKFQRAMDAAKKTVQITYLNPTIDSHGYYLFANTDTIRAGGAEVDADAVWDDGNSTTDFPLFGDQKNLIPVDENGGDEGSGALELYGTTSGIVQDRVGWDRTGHPAPFYEGQAIVQSIGLQRNELYARKTSIADSGGVTWTLGPSLDTNSNSVDFYGYSGGISTQPHSSAFGTQGIIAGTPAIGAMISCSDGLSASTEAVRIHVAGTPDLAYFTLVNVSTGLWTVYISSGVNALPLTAGTVDIASAGVSVLFSSTSTFLTEYRNTGFVTGSVRDSLGAPLSGITVTSGGANNTTTAADGTYRLPVLPSVVNITANPAVGGNAYYVTASSVNITVESGMVHPKTDFLLYRGGRISGFVTRDGVNGLPGVSVAMLDANSIARDQQVSGTDGRFTSVILSTGQYIVYPSIGSLETSTPENALVSVLTMGVTQFSSTFTITGALGAISGTVTSGGQRIKTGALIVVTTATLAGTPPAPPDISTNTLTGYPLYMVSSLENGTFTVEVRQSTNPPYNVYAYYPQPSGSATVLISSKIPNIPVTAGQTYSGVDFSW